MLYLRYEEKVWIGQMALGIGAVTIGLALIDWRLGLAGFGATILYVGNK